MNEVYADLYAMTGNAEYRTLAERFSHKAILMPLSRGHDHLEAVDGDRAAALVFFCKADCWMSWNAARRAVALGYGRVGWFPGGTDAWAAEGRALVPAVPAD